MTQNPQIIHLRETTSTNAYMRELSEAEPLASGTIVRADFQTAGRGLSGNSWESEDGKNLLFSALLYPEDVPANRPFVIAEIAALSIKQTLDKYIPDVSVKWSNDIYCGDKKIAGILIENTLFQGKITKSIIGTGININQTTFHSDAPNPVSMAQITGNIYDRSTILQDFRKFFATQSARLNKRQFDAIHDDYLGVIYRKDGFYSYRDDDGIFEAQIHNIEPSGNLVLKRPNGIISRYAFKEVEYCV